MKFNGPVITNLLSWPISLTIRAWVKSLRSIAWYQDETVDPAHFDRQPSIYIYWHENLLLPLFMRAGPHFTVLLSQHRDADILQRIASRFGAKCVRGSSYRGGTKALLELREALRNSHLTMTPDGPRGPRRKLAPGAIYIASMMNMPIVCLGVAHRKPWRLGSWDRFAMPRPFAKARVIVSEAIHIPGDLKKDEIETWRRQVEQTLNHLTEEAQIWVDSGEHREGERPLRRGKVKKMPVPPIKLKLSDAA